MKKAINQSTLTFILNGISILMLAFIVVSLFMYNDANNQLYEADVERFDLTYSANQFMDGSSYLTNEVRAFAATCNKEHYDNYWNEVNNLKNRDKGIANMKEIGITKDEQEMIENMSSISDGLVPLEEKAMEQAADGGREQAVAYVYGTEYSEAIKNINSIKEDFLNTLEKRTSSKVQEMKDKVYKVKVILQVAVLVTGIIQFLNMIVVNVRIIKPVTIIRDQMLEISKGNLSASFSLQPDTSETGMLVSSIYDTKKQLKTYISDIDQKLAQMAKGNMNLENGNGYIGEFRPIQEAMGKILDSLNNALYKIHFTAEKVSRESERMATGAQTLSNGAMKQAATIEELSSSIQELSGQVNATSNDASNAKQCSSDASVQLGICAQEMENLTAAMDEISKSSQEIGGIIKTIEDISFQTNILALNASVEAARAGQAGKGFSVVANEVQTLANKSAASAKDISGLINKSMLLVKQGAELTAQTTKTLSEVVTGAHKSTSLVNHIAESAIQQSNSLRELTMGMEQIADVVQTTAATAEESSSSADELNKHALELKASVQKFRLRSTHNN